MRCPTVEIPNSTRRAQRLTNDNENISIASSLDCVNMTNSQNETTGNNKRCASQNFGPSKAPRKEDKNSREPGPEIDRLRGIPFDVRTTICWCNAVERRCLSALDETQMAWGDCFGEEETTDRTLTSWAFHLLGLTKKQDAKSARIVDMCEASLDLEQKRWLPNCGDHWTGKRDTLEEWCDDLLSNDAHRRGLEQEKQDLENNLQESGWDPANHCFDSDNREDDLGDGDENSGGADVAIQAGV